jgi:hypothetical protein
LEAKRIIKNKMCVFVFSITLYEAFFTLRRTEWYRIINLYFCVRVSTNHSCQILKKLEFSRQVLENPSDIKFHEKTSRGSWVLSCGRTDRHNEADSRFSQLCERGFSVPNHKHISSLFPFN